MAFISRNEKKSLEVELKTIKTMIENQTLDEYQSKKEKSNPYDFKTFLTQAENYLTKNKEFDQDILSKNTKEDLIDMIEFGIWWSRQPEAEIPDDHIRKQIQISSYRAWKEHSEKTQKEFREKWLDDENENV